MTTATQTTTVSTSQIRRLTGVAMLAAVSAVLMFIDFSVPFMPSFIKMDVSELPALLAAFAYGPIWGVAVCLIKNIFNLIFHSSTGGVGELCNFLLGALFVFPAGFIYQRIKSRKGALIGALIGAASMALLSVPLNYFITYPLYIAMYASFGGWDAILGMYQAIFPGVSNLIGCLVIFNLPFTFFKGIVDSVLCFLIYKSLSPILHGRK